MNNKINSAIECYNTFIQLEPSSSNAHNNLGSAYKSKNNLYEAQKCYERAIQLNPNNVLALTNLGTVF